MTRRMQNSQESTISVELRGDLWGPEHNSYAAASAVSSTLAACCRIQSKASAEVWEPRPPHLAIILDLYGALHQAAAKKP